MTSAQRLAAVLFVVLVMLALPQAALAAAPIFVGNGTPGSCTETALKDALIIAETVGGGTIRFKCGAGAVTIGLSQVTTSPGFPVLLVLPNNTTIDGGGVITLDGTGTGMVLFVDSATSGALTGLTITNGLLPVGLRLAGGIFNLGTLVISKSTVSGCDAPIGSGTGAIRNTGTLTIRHSVIANNFGDAGAGVVNEGTLTIHNTLFDNNDAFFLAGGIWNSGTLKIYNSTFSRNRSPDGFGGAIVGDSEIRDSVFTENTAAFGGAIYGDGTISGSTFSENVAIVGGAINGGSWTVSDTTFALNLAGRAGGAMFSSGSVLIRNSHFIENSSSGDGGGAYYSSGSLTVSGSTFQGNRTIGNGGAIITEGPLVVRDSRITQNTARLLGGGIFVSPLGTLTLKDTSVTENTPDDIFP